MLKSFNLITKLKDSVLSTANLNVIRQIHVTKHLESGDNEKTSFLDRVFGTKVEKATQAHSVLLADQQILYELQIHNVKPEFALDYQNIYKDYVPKLLNNNKNLKLTGSWKSEVGIQDQYVHLWRYKNYSEFSDVFNRLKKDDEHEKFVNRMSKMVNQRENQICLSFTFWGEPDARPENHIYEMRSYSLKPGTLIEWGNNWSRGIRNRMDYRVAGMFTQIGPLYYVHHIWAYKNLADRKASREKMWDKPGWDECVAYTVPLIRKMDSKIMTALPFSPMK